MMNPIEVDRWVAAWADLGVMPPPAGVIEALIAAYAEPHRAYHNQRHLSECLTHLGSVRALLHRPAEVELAAWFHDAIYDTKAHDNEQQSAEWAARTLRDAGQPESTARSVHDLIMATKHDGSPESHDAQYLVDADLAILGANPPRFDEYEEEVRREYSWVDEDAFRAGRTRVLQMFQARHSIYTTEEFRLRFEDPARANLRRSLARLGQAS